MLAVERFYNLCFRNVSVTSFVGSQCKVTRSKERRVHQGKQCRNGDKCNQLYHKQPLKKVIIMENGKIKERRLMSAKRTIIRTWLLAIEKSYNLDMLSVCQCFILTGSQYSENNIGKRESISHNNVDMVINVISDIINNL